MKRRSFLKNTGISAIGLPVMLNGISFNSLANAPFIKALQSTASSGKILVLIQLNGGNDGLNMVIPVGEYSHLSKSNSEGGRSNILVDENDVVDFVYGGVQQHVGTGLHPSMTGLADMFANGHLNVLQGVGYPNPSFSHFRATDIWMSGSDSGVYEQSGWVGRYLEHEHPSYSTSLPSDPLAITIGAVSSSVYDTGDINMGIAVQNSQSTGYFSGNTDVAPNSLYGFELEHIRTVAQQSNSFATAISDAYTKGSNVATYPDNNSLAAQLKTVARLIKGDLETNFYMVNMGSFDTHDGQVNAGDTKTGWHANMLGNLSEAMHAFMADLSSMSNSFGPMEDQVLGLTVSEFGRTIKSNSTNGTDHGTTAPMFLFGKEAKPLVVGSNPEIWDASAGKIKSDLAMQLDFRSVYASILHQWFGMATTDVDTLFGKIFNDGSMPSQDWFDGGFHCNLPILKSSPIAPAPLTGIEELTAEAILVYPNPNSGVLRFKNIEASEQYELSLFDVNGKAVYSAYHNFHDLQRGVSVDKLSGNYILQLRNVKNGKAIKTQISIQ